VRTDAIFRPSGTDSRDLTTLFSVHRLGNIHQRAQTVRTLHPKKDVNLNNNFSVGPTDCGRSLKWLTLKIICCYN